MTLRWIIQAVMSPRSPVSESFSLKTMNPTLPEPLAETEELNATASDSIEGDQNTAERLEPATNPSTGIGGGAINGELLEGAEADGGKLNVKEDKGSKPNAGGVRKVLKSGIFGGESIPLSASGINDQADCDQLVLRSHQLNPDLPSQNLPPPFVLHSRPPNVPFPQAPDYWPLPPVVLLSSRRLASLSLQRERCRASRPSSLRPPNPPYPERIYLARQRQSL